MVDESDKAAENYVCFWPPAKSEIFNLTYEPRKMPALLTQCHFWQSLLHGGRPNAINADGVCSGLRVRAKYVEGFLGPEPGAPCAEPRPRAPGPKPRAPGPGP